MDTLHDRVVKAQAHYKKLVVEFHAIPKSEQIYNGNSYYKTCLYDLMNAGTHADQIMALFLEKAHQYIIHKTNSVLTKQSDARISSYEVISPGNFKLKLNLGNSTPEQLENVNQTLEKTKEISERKLKKRYPRLNGTSERQPAREERGVKEPAVKRRAIS
jgi:hypothetical protein